MSRIKVVIFDVDGVLLDSLPQHLKICEDKSKEYGLGLRIPDAWEFKEMVRRGVRISPMKYFFLAVGFPEEFAEKADLQYQEMFMQAYAPAPFPGVHWALSALHDAGLQMGIVTSNVRTNIVKALGQSIDFFHPACIYSKETLANMSKSEAIRAVMTKFQASPGETVYVGDQPADWEAARAAGTKFLGVAYGWGISQEDKDFPVVGEISEVYRNITGRAITLPGAHAERTAQSKS